MLEPSSPSPISSRQGQIPKRSALGQGICQKGRVVAPREPLADHLRHEREVVVLHQNDGIVRVDLLADGVGEFAVDRDVLGPIARAEFGPGVRHVAERPEPAVRHAVVEASLLRFV